MLGPRTPFQFGTLLLALLGLSGCVSAYHQGTSLELDPEARPPDPRPSLIVGVREPRIVLDDPLFEGDEPKAIESQIEVRRSLRLIRSLRASNRFRLVDFERQLPCPPDLVVATVENPEPIPVDGDMGLLILYLGIIPIWHSWDGGHFFADVEHPDAIFAFPWTKTEVVWWLNPLLWAFPSWERELDHEAPLAGFSLFLGEHWERLTAGLDGRESACDLD